MKDALGHGSDPRGGAQAVADQHGIPTQHLQPQPQELSGTDHPGHEIMRAALAAGEKLSLHDKRAINDVEFNMTRFQNKISGSGSDHKYVEPFPGISRPTSASQVNAMRVASNRLHATYLGRK